MKGVYKLYKDCGRMGSISGTFIATAAEVELLMGREVNFGEVLGKHSEVYFTMTPDNITLVTTDEKAVSVIEEHDLTSGFSPFDYEIEGLEQDDNGEWVVVGEAEDEEEEDEDE